MSLSESVSDLAARIASELKTTVKPNLLPSTDTQEISDNLQGDYYFYAAYDKQEVAIDTGTVDSNGDPIYIYKAKGMSFVPTSKIISEIIYYINNSETNDTQYMFVQRPSNYGRYTSYSPDFLMWNTLEAYNYSQSDVDTQTGMLINFDTRKIGLAISNRAPTSSDGQELDIWFQVTV